LVTVTVSPDWVQVPFQPVGWICWFPVKTMVTVHPVIAVVPLFVTLKLAASSQSRRFFQVWLSGKLPRRTDHPV